MATWLVECCRWLNGDLDDPSMGRDLLCFRIFPENEPDRWIAQTNPSLPLHVQEEAALLIADALSKVLGV
jgi:hypothetical protein